MKKHKAIEATLERARSYGAIARDALAIFPPSHEKMRWKRSSLSASTEATDCSLRQFVSEVSSGSWLAPTIAGARAVSCCRCRLCRRQIAEQRKARRSAARHAREQAAVQVAQRCQHVIDRRHDAARGRFEAVAASPRRCPERFADS